MMRQFPLQSDCLLCLFDFFTLFVLFSSRMCSPAPKPGCPCRLKLQAYGLSFIATGNFNLDWLKGKTRCVREVFFYMRTLNRMHLCLCLKDCISPSAFPYGAGIRS